MCGISITRRANAIDQIQHRGIESAQIAEGGWFLGHDDVRFALRLPREYRTHKRILKDAFRDDLPQEIIDRPKECQSIRQDPTAYRKKCHETFYRLWQ